MLSVLDDAESNDVDVHCLLDADLVVSDHVDPSLPRFC